MSCAYTYAITTPMKCAFGIVTQIEHHIPPQLNAVHSIRKNAKRTKIPSESSNSRDLILLDPILAKSVSYAKLSSSSYTKKHQLK